ncbi:hypothetical protein GQ42DRAFT_105655, partial [Ramicandelaber brevisporus]
LNIPHLEFTNSLTVVNCNGLKDLSFPELSTIGGSILLTNNTQLSAISDNAFPKLTNIAGSFMAAGSIKRITLPSLQSVRGSFLFHTTASLECEELRAKL